MIELTSRGQCRPETFWRARPTATALGVLADVPFAGHVPGLRAWSPPTLE